MSETGRTRVVGPGGHVTVRGGSQLDKHFFHKGDPRREMNRAFICLRLLMLPRGQRGVCR